MKTFLWDSFNNFTERSLDRHCNDLATKLSTSRMCLKAHKAMLYKSKTGWNPSLKNASTFNV